ncbi:hypothetical protein [Sphingomonas sp. IW22]|uniref:hypothetical protein n=1 Tax=Sphingomonas sp. IW22 TaxID=3242489 RepID=UPI003520CA4D
MAHTEPDTVEMVLRIVEQRASQLLAPTDAQPVLDSVMKIRRGTYHGERDQAACNQVEAHTRRVANRISHAAPPAAVVRGLDAGVGLGRVEHDVDGVPSKTYISNLKQSLRAILPTSSTPGMDAKFRAAAKKSSG